ncbi:MAG: hypothetical protein ACYC96_12085 [Fimbriimonadaceae bacterium]
MRFTMTSTLARFFGLAAVFAAALAHAQSIPAEQLAGLRWRNIGPFRGGRVSAVAGVPGSGATFYMGLPAGGIWKTTSAGQTWFPVFDAVRDTACVGSIAVAPSDPKVIYAGTGEISAQEEGAGVYRSDDAGGTWRSVGLEATKIVPTILVDPKDANTAILAALGAGTAKSDKRGVFRTTDGGKTWQRTLAIDDEIGIADLAWAGDNPTVVFAASMQHFRQPGVFRPNPQEATGTDLYKSIDEGLTWKKLTGKGLPKLFGRCGVAVGPGTDSQRVYLIGMFGLYRSDDGGANWRRMDAGDRRIANGQGNYSCGVYTDSKNPDVVYTIATCVYRSLDGGESFEAFKGAPDGDDPQQMWIDPTDGNRILLGGDQGAVVSLDAGSTWGSWYNQPTGQFYHIAVTNDWPYWVYGTQQDSGSIGTASRGNLGQIGPTDWTPHPGGESGPMVADPLDSRITYCQGASGLERVMFPSMQWTPINPPDRPGDTFGFVRWIGFSAGNPHELLAGSQFLLASTDRGDHWRRLSPNLTVKPEEKPTPGRPPMFGGNAIATVAASPLDANTIWVGTSNGMIKLTRDHGKSWLDVTIPNAPGGARASISCIAAGPKDKAEAYALVGAPFGVDASTHVFRTRDFGHSWTETDNGLGNTQPGRGAASVIVCDAKKAGLIFLATSSAVFCSVDDGDQWQPLNLNLPVTTFSDLVVHGDDLVLATYGRGIWVLDDFAPLRELSAAVRGEAVHLFKPALAIRVRRNMNQDTPFPPEVPHALNPPLGALIDYSLASPPSGLVTLEIVDRDGRAVRHYSSAPIEAYHDPKPPEPDFWFEPRLPMPTQAGLNRINWDLRYDIPPALVHDPSYPGPAVEHDTPFAIEGPLVVPGVYTARLTVDGKTYTQAITVVNDPRSPGTQRDMEAMHVVQMRLYDGVKEAYDGYQQVEAMRKAVAAVLASKPVDEVAKAAKAFDEKLAALVGGAGPRPGMGRRMPGRDFGGECGALLGEMNGLDNGDLGPTDWVQVSAGQSWAALKGVTEEWRALNGKDLKAFNDVLTSHALKPIEPAPALQDPPAPPKRFLPPPPKPPKAQKAPAKAR